MRLQLIEVKRNRFNEQYNTSRRSIQTMVDKLVRSGNSAELISQYENFQIIDERRAHRLTPTKYHETFTLKKAFISRLQGYIDAAYLYISCNLQGKINESISKNITEGLLSVITKAEESAIRFSSDELSLYIEQIITVIVSAGCIKEKPEKIFDDLYTAANITQWIPLDKHKWSQSITLVTLSEFSSDNKQFTVVQVDIPRKHYTSALRDEWFGIFLPESHSAFPEWFKPVTQSSWEKWYWENFLYEIFILIALQQSKYTNADLAFFQKDVFKELIQAKLFDCKIPDPIHSRKYNADQSAILKYLAERVDKYTLHALFAYLPSSPCTDRKYPGLSNYREHGFLIYSEDCTLIGEYYRHRASTLAPYQIKNNLEKVEQTQLSLEQYIEDQICTNHDHSRGLEVYLRTLLSPLIFNDVLSCEAPALSTIKYVVDRFRVELNDGSNNTHLKIRSVRIKEKKRVSIIDSNISINEFRAGKKLSSLALADDNSHFYTILDLLRDWSEREDHPDAKQLGEIVNEDWSSLKDKPLHSIIPRDHAHSKGTFIFQLAILYLQCQQDQQKKNRRNDHAALILSSAEELLLAQLDYHVISGCKSGKDRRGISLLYENALLSYYALKKRFPVISHFDDSKQILNDLFIMLFLSGHQQRVAEFNARGCFGLKSLKAILPSDIHHLIHRESQNVLDHNQICSNYNRPRYIRAARTSQSDPLMRSGSSSTSISSSANMELESEVNKWAIDVGVDVSEVKELVNQNEADTLVAGPLQKNDEFFPFEQKEPAKPTSSSHISSALQNVLDICNKSSSSNRDKNASCQDDIAHEHKVMGANQQAIAKNRKLSVFTKFRKKLFTSSAAVNKSDTQERLIRHINNEAWENVESLLISAKKSKSIDDVENENTLLTFVLEQLIEKPDFKFSSVIRVLQAFKNAGASFSIAKRGSLIPLDYMYVLINIHELFPAKIEDFTSLCLVLAEELNERDQKNESFIINVLAQVFIPHLLSIRQSIIDQQVEIADFTIQTEISRIIQYLMVLRENGMDCNASKARTLTLDYVVTTIQDKFRHFIDSNEPEATDLPHIIDLLKFSQRMVDTGILNPFQNSNHSATSFDQIALLWSSAKSQNAKEVITYSEALIEACLAVKPGKPTDASRQLTNDRLEYFSRCPGLEVTLKKRSGFLKKIIKLCHNQELLFSLLNCIRDRLSKSTYNKIVLTLKAEEIIKKPAIFCHLNRLELPIFYSIQKKIDTDRSNRPALKWHEYINEESVICLTNYTRNPELDLTLAINTCEELQLPTQSAGENQLTKAKWFGYLNVLYASLMTTNDKNIAIPLWNKFIKIIQTQYTQSPVTRNIIGDTNNLDTVISCLKRLTPFHSHLDRKVKLLTSSSKGSRTSKSSKSSSSSSSTKLSSAIYSILKRSNGSLNFRQQFNSFYIAYDLEFGNHDDWIKRILEVLSTTTPTESLKQFVRKARNDLVNPKSLKEGDDTLLTLIISRHYQDIAVDFSDLMKSFNSKVNFNLHNGNGMSPLYLLVKRVIQLDTPSHWRNVLELISQGAKVYDPHNRSNLEAQDFLTPLEAICNHFINRSTDPSMEIFTDIMFYLLQQNNHEVQETKACLARFWRNVSEDEIQFLITPLLQKLQKQKDSNTKNYVAEILLSIIIDANAPSLINYFIERGFSTPVTNSIPLMGEKWNIKKTDIISDAIRLNICVFFTKPVLEFINKLPKIVPLLQKVPIHEQVFKSVILLYITLKDAQSSYVLERHQTQYFELCAKLSNELQKQNLSNLQLFNKVLTQFIEHHERLNVHEINSALNGILSCEKYWLYNPEKFVELIEVILQQVQSDVGLNNVSSRALLMQSIDDDDEPADPKQSWKTQNMVGQLTNLQSTLFHMTVAGLPPLETVQAFVACKEFNVFDCLSKKRYSPDTIGAWLTSYPDRVSSYQALSTLMLNQRLRTAINESRICEAIAILDAFVVRILKPMKLRYTQIIAILALVDDFFNDESNSKSAIRDIFAEIKTGQGKSLVIILAAVCYILKKGPDYRVHILSANEILSKRDSHIFGTLLSELQITYSDGSLFPAENSSEDNQDDDNSQTISPMITYTTLRHIATAHCRDLIGVFKGKAPTPLTKTLGLFDEVDLQLYQVNGALHIQLHTLLKKFDLVFKTIWKNQHLNATNANAIPGLQSILDNDIPTEFRSYVKTCVPMLIATAKQVALERRGVDYTIDGDDVVLITSTTNSVLRRVVQGNGRTLFISLKEGLRVPPTQLRTVVVSYEKILNSYERLMGVSGSLGLTQERNALLRTRLPNQRKITMFNVPLYYAKKSNCIESTPIVYQTEQQWCMELPKLADIYSKSGLPILVIVDTEAKVEAVYNILIQVHGRSSYNTLKITGLHKDHKSKDTKVSTIVAKAGAVIDGVGTITVSTRFGARGNDFQVHAVEQISPAAKLGMGVLGNWCDDENEEIQMWGRTARQDNPGWVQLVTSQTEILDYLKHIKDDYNITHSAQIDWQDPKQIVNTLKLLRRQVAVAKITEREMQSQKARALDQLTTAFFNAVQKSPTLPEGLEETWSVFLTELTRSRLLAANFDPNNAEFIKACKTEFQAELADYNGCYERGVLMTYLLFSRMAKFNLPFDQEPGSLLHQLTNGYNVLYPYAPISHMSSNTSSTSTLRSFGTFFGSHNIDSGALDPQASPKSLAKK